MGHETRAGFWLWIQYNAPLNDSLLGGGLVLTPQVALHASLLYDAIWLYALSVNRSLSEDHRASDPSAVSRALFNTHIEGKPPLLLTTHPKLQVIVNEITPFWRILP